MKPYKMVNSTLKQLFHNYKKYQLVFEYRKEKVY